MNTNEHLRYWSNASAEGIGVDTSDSETRLERAQRLYVEDKISMEVFERRLERILR